jgi:hypothetical protein
LIPLPTTLIGFICSAVWFGYGLLLSDPAIIVPNGLGVLFSLVNLITIFILRNVPKVNEIIDTDYNAIHGENEKIRKNSDI